MRWQRRHRQKQQQRQYDHHHHQQQHQYAQHQQQQPYAHAQSPPRAPVHTHTHASAPAVQAQPQVHSPAATHGGTAVGGSLDGSFDHDGLCIGSPPERSYSERLQGEVAKCRERIADHRKALEYASRQSRASAGGLEGGMGTGGDGMMGAGGMGEEVAEQMRMEYTKLVAYQVLLCMRRVNE